MTGVIGKHVCFFCLRSALAQTTRDRQTDRDRERHRHRNRHIDRHRDRQRETGTETVSNSFKRVDSNDLQRVLPSHAPLQVKRDYDRSDTQPTERYIYRYRYIHTVRPNAMNSQWSDDSESGPALAVPCAGATFVPYPMGHVTNGFF